MSATFATVLSIPFAHVRSGMEPDPWLSVNEVAKMLGVSRSTVWRMPVGRLPYEESRGGKERGGRRRYRTSAVLSLGKRPDDMPLVERVAQLERRVDRLDGGATA